MANKHGVRPLVLGAVAVLTLVTATGAVNVAAADSLAPVDVEESAAAPEESGWQDGLDVPGTLTTIQTALGDSFAGSWLDNEQQTWTVLATTQPDPTLLSDLDGSIPPEAAAALRFEVAEYSFATLNQFQESVNAYAATPAGIDISYTQLDERQNVIEVGVTVQVSAAVIDTLYELVPVDALVLVRGNGDYARLEESQLDGRIPYKAGKFANLPGSPEFGRCTSGYVWLRSGEYLGSTAGHCLLDNDAFYLGTKNPTFYGFGFRNQFTGRTTVNADIVFVRGTTPTNPTPNLLWASSTETRVVNAGAGVPPTGTTVRMVGAATISGSTGTVNATNVGLRSRDGFFFYAGGTCASYSSSTGDSGAPVFKRPPDSDRYATAYGMHFASRYNDRNQRVAGCYHDIQRLATRSGVSLLLSS
jgi:hypothetical protein